MVVPSFGAELAARRRARGLTLRALAARAELSPAYLCDLEHGRRGARPSDATIARLAVAMEFPPATFSIWRGRVILATAPAAVDRLYRELFPAEGVEVLGG